MEVHELNCCTMQVRLAGNPLGRSAAQRVVTRCLLLDTGNGLVLVDTGIGTADINSPLRRLGATWVTMSRPTLDPAETALHQVRALGFDPGDVRHVVLTHMDLDHVGGLADFPRATAHVSELEYRVAHARRLPGMQRGRYRPAQWRSHDLWMCYPPGGDVWFGIAGATTLDGVPGVLLVPLPGHSEGHCGVAVRLDDGWLLHAGDALLVREQLDPAPHRLPLGLAAFDLAIKADRPGYIRSLEHLRRLARERDVHVCNTHDPRMCLA